MKKKVIGVLPVQDWEEQEDYYDRSKWIPLEEARRMVIESITREYDRIHACDNENKDD